MVEVCEGVPVAVGGWVLTDGHDQCLAPDGTQRVQAMSKEDKMKLEPSVATSCVDGSTPMVW